MIAFTLLLWLLCALWSHRLFYASFRRLSSDPTTAYDDRRGAVWMSVGGPLSLIVAVVLSREVK